MDVDMMSVMMQMEKPTSPNSHHHHHHHHNHNQHLQFCDEPNSTTTSFLDVNFFSDHHHHSNVQPQHNNNNPNNTNSNSYMGLTNPNNSNTHQHPNNARALSNKINNTSGATMARSNHHHHHHSNNNNSMAAMREMIFRIAAMQPIHIDPEAIKPPKRRNVRISKDPQSVAARHRRERISERIRILQRLVPGGTKMDTASMLDEAIHYVKFLKNQVQTLEQAGAHHRPPAASGALGFPVVGPGMSGSTNNLSYNSGCASPLAESMRMLR